MDKGENGAEVWAQGRAHHEKGEAKKAFALYTRAAKLGHVPAINSLGVCHMTGFGVKKTDSVKAVEFFRHAAAQEEVGAMVNLAHAYSKGDGVAKDAKSAFEWYSKAAELGDVDALFQTGVALIKGCGVAADVVKAFGVFQEAANRGCDRALNYLGVCYGEGFGVKKDPKKAAEMFEAGAAVSDPRALFNLASVYQNGIGVEKDPKKSLELHIKAAQLGCDDSLVMIGTFYLKGIAVLVDEKKAFELFQKAAEKDNASAMNLLGLCYLRGHGARQDPQKALVHFKRAANLGDVPGMCNLANSYLNGVGIKKNEEKAVELFQNAVNLGSTEAMLSLALWFAERDAVKALELLNRAAEKRNARALFTRGQWFEFGNAVVQKDFAASLESYRRASLEGHKEASEKYRQLVEDSLPETVKRGGKKQIDQYVQDLIETGSVKWAKAKVMVLGKEGVGKTALYHKVRGKPYGANLSTDGIDVHTFSVKNMELIWFDFGGQTIFYPTHQFFLTARCVYLVCFKFGDEESIERAKYWLQDVENLTHDPTRPVKLVVIGTHVDWVSTEDQDLIWERLKPMMDSSGHVVGHVGVSCKDGTGLDGVLKGIELALNASRLGALQVPKSYLMIECFIKESRNEGSKQMMEWSAVRDVFPALSKHQLEQAFEFFTDMGLCVCDKKLGVFVSDPQWLARTFSGLISFSQQWVKEGVVTVENLSHVWKDLDEKEVERVMSVFERFGVAFMKRQGRCWIIPSLLVDKKSTFEFGPPPLPMSERVFELDFVPFGLFGRLIARLDSWCELGGGGRVKLASVCKKSVVLETSECMAEIAMDIDRKALVVRCVQRPLSLSPPSRRTLTVGGSRGQQRDRLRKIAHSFSSSRPIWRSHGTVSIIKNCS